MKKHLVRTSSALIALLVSLCCVFGFATTAFAGGSFKDAVALSSEAMSLYDDFELEDAEAKIRSAVQIIETSKINDPSVANIYVAQGVIGYGRLKDSAPAIAEERAYASFLKAVSLKSTVEIPNDYRTPELDEILARAKNDLKSGGIPVIAGEAPKPAIEHNAIVTGNRCGAVPVVVLANNPEEVENMTLYYQSDSETTFKSVRMDHDPANVKSFKGTIPGSATIGSQIRYYVEASSSSKGIIGSAGTSNRPFTTVLSGECNGLTDEDLEVVYGTPLFQFNVNAGTGFAIARKGMLLERWNFEKNNSVTATGAAVTPFFIRASGVFNLPYNLQLGVFLRGQFANMIDSEKDLYGIEHGSVFPSLMLGVALRYLVLNKQPYRLYVGAEFGWGGANASIKANNKTNLIVIDGVIHVAPQVGFLWTFHKNVGLNVELTVPIHFVKTDYPTAHFDLSVGPFFQF